MDEEHFALQNASGLVIRGAIYRPKPKGRFPLVVIAPDFFDNAESPNIKETARLLLENNIAVVRFDFTNGYGVSDGHGSDTTISQRAHDLENIIEYVRRRGYINEKKISILGYGFGAMAALVLAGFKQVAQALVLVNTPHDVAASSWTTFDDRDMLRIRLKQYFHVPIHNEQLRINYGFFEDGKRVDMARCSRNLNTPTLYLVSEQDTVVNPESSQWLFERTPGEKEYEGFPNLGHIDGRKGVKMIVDRAVAFLKTQKAA